MTDTEHPLRRRMIMLAALDNITPEQRENTIKLACPGWEREHALQMLRQIHEAHKRRSHVEVNRLVEQLIEGPPPKQEEE